MIDKTIGVYLGVNTLPTIVECTEGDTMWRWHFEVYFNSQRWTIPSGGTVMFTGKKADGNVFDMLETIENNEAVVVCDEQMTAAVGPAACVLRFLDTEGKTVASTPIVLAVKPNPQTQGPMSETVLSAYNDVLQMLGDAIDMPAEVTEWLDEHITQETGYVLDTSLTIAGAAADAKATGEAVTDLKIALDEYEDIFTGDVDESVQNWLDAHPEATTTVEDGSLTEAKFSNALKLKSIKDYVTPEMFGAMGDGVTDDTEALLSAFGSNKDVYLAGTYLTNATLIFRGAYLFGRGTIIANSALNTVIDCRSNTLIVSGISVDCNNIAAGGIYCYGLNSCFVINCNVYNTDNNGLADPVTCFGIRAASFQSVIVRGCICTNISRTKTSPGSVSSVGILATSVNTVTISNCVINGVSCLNEKTDCDGIFVTGNTANINSNRIIDATGRGIKTQCLNTVVIDNNYIAQINSVGPMFFKCADFQTCGGTFSNNYIDLSDKCNSDSEIIHVDYTSSASLRTINIIGNNINVTNSIACIVNCAGDYFSGAVTIRENLVTVGANMRYCVRVRPSTLQATICIDSNTLNTYRLINPLGNTDMTAITVFVTDNLDVYGPQIFSSAVSINNLIIHGNKGVVEQVNNVTMDFAQMTNYEVLYRGSTAISNLPSSLADVTGIYLRRLGYNLFQYYEFTHGTSGILRN